jgi:hypothetical protein
VLCYDDRGVAATESYDAVVVGERYNNVENKGKYWTGVQQTNRSEHEAGARLGNADS